MITPSTTVGAEIEIPNVGQAATAGMEKWLRFKIGNDGSLRDTTYVAGSLSVFPEFDKRGSPILSAGMRQQPAFGLEIIIDPYSYADLAVLSGKVAHYLSTAQQNSRASIHVHVDIGGETWKEVRSLLLWVHALEAIVYRIACGGKEHRGAKSYQGQYNDHKFARPLSSPIGVQYLHTDRILPLIDWDLLVNATTASEFVASWGRLDTYWGREFDHYMPHRLHCINLASILRLGTIEWRVFDGLYQYFDLFVQFVYKMHELSSKGEPDVHFPLGSSPGVDAQWVSSLLDMDVEQLWGEQWQRGCENIAPLSHYPHQPTLRSLDELAVRRITVGRMIDLGADDFVLYRR